MYLQILLICLAKFIEAEKQREKVSGVNVSCV